MYIYIYIYINKNTYTQREMNKKNLSLGGGGGKGRGEGRRERNLRPMQAFRKNFLQRCDILLRDDRGKEVYTECPYPCHCHDGCLNSGLGFENVAIGFFLHDARRGGRIRGRCHMCG